MRWLPWILLGGVVSAFFLLRERKAPVAYITATVSRGTIEDAVSATGDLKAKEYVDIGAQVSGVLKKIHVSLGQAVSAGDLLGQIDPTVLEARVAEAEATLKNLAAQLEAAEASRKLAEQQLTRNRNLLREDAVSQDELDRAEAEFARSGSAIAALKAQMEKARGTLAATSANLGFTKIVTPLTGTVVQIQAREGQTLNASQTAPILFRVADLSTMTVEAQVSEADIQKIRPGQPAYFTTLGAPDLRHDGRVRCVEPSPASTNPPVFYNTLFDVPNPGLSLMPEMTAQVFFPMMSRSNVLVMPLAALDYTRKRGSASRRGARGAGKNGSSRVYVLRDGAPAEVPVVLGASNRVSVEVVSGLREEDEVITGPVEPTAQSRPPKSSFR
jgi:macrolide-specific efflux system membrane fusion protein